MYIVWNLKFRSAILLDKLELLSSATTKFWLFIVTIELYGKIVIGHRLPISATFSISFATQCIPASHHKKFTHKRQMVSSDVRLRWTGQDRTSMERIMSCWRFQRCHKKEKGWWVRLSNYQVSKGRPQDLLAPRVSCKIFYKQITINKCKRQWSLSGWIKRWIENTNGHHYIYNTT